MSKDPLMSVKRRFAIIGRSEALNRALYTAVKVAPTDLTVLISGESGVGKEVFSKVIHQLSVRKHEQFIAINCGAIPKGTINSELFGHEKGAFTGATGDRKGYFETANGGTIFLDEVGEMPMDTQSYLLRILESGEFIKVGSSKVQKTDVRVIAASNVELKDSIKNGKFREDLFYRLNTVPIQVPALYQRPEDIYMLFRKFANDFGEKYSTSPIKLDDAARSLLEHYRWPGNVRELKNLVEQLSVMSEKRELDVLDLAELAPHLRERNLPSISNVQEEESFGGNYEREILYKVLFDMRNDMNELKTMIHEMVKMNNLSVPDMEVLSNNVSLPPGNYQNPNYYPQQSEYSRDEDYDDNKPYVVDHNKYDDSEIVEEDLSLENMEKIMIQKALDKYDGRRKDAAGELGISERTLYRKIKQYEIG